MHRERKLTETLASQLADRLHCILLLLLLLLLLLKCTDHNDAITKMLQGNIKQSDWKCIVDVFWSPRLDLLYILSVNNTSGFLA